MIPRISRFWKKLSLAGVPHSITPDERKLHISANQLLIASLLLILGMVSSLLIAWWVLLRVDAGKYGSYFWGGTPPAIGLFSALLVFYYRAKTRSFYGPIVVLAYLMIALVSAMTVVFGGFFGLEYWILIVMGMGIYILHRKPLLRNLNIVISFVMFLSLRLWILQHPALLPADYAPVRLFYYIVLTTAIFIFILLEFRFIAQQGSEAEDAFMEQRDRADRLLLNIMPATVATELKEKGVYEPRHYDAVTVLFTDFVGFTRMAASLSPSELLRSLDTAFRKFDEIADRHGLEKLKTIGDAYMCAAGIPDPVADHVERACRAALEFRDTIREQQGTPGGPGFDIRIGLHCGPIVAGIIGERKFAYDIWGDTVNIAARMESAGEGGKVNVSPAVADAASASFRFRSRGMHEVKGIGRMEMFELLEAV